MHVFAKSLMFDVTANPPFSGSGLMGRLLAGATGIVAGKAGTADLPRGEQPLPRYRQPRAYPSPRRARRRPRELQVYWYLASDCQSTILRTVASMVDELRADEAALTRGRSMAGELRWISTFNSSP
jgi:hypothetical protein